MTDAEQIAIAIAAEERGDLGGCPGDQYPIDQAIHWCFLRRNFDWSDQWNSEQYNRALAQARRYHSSLNI